MKAYVVEETEENIEIRKELFDKYQYIAEVTQDLIKDLSAIIQNPVHITEEQFVDWKKDFRKTSDNIDIELESVYNDTIEFITHN